MKLGDFNDLTVVRESDIAYILSDGHEEIFLHKKEALKPYQPNDVVRVFIYTDNQGRPTASTKEPLATIARANFLEVVSVNHKYGVFLNNHLIKDLLLSLDDLPLQLDLWPKPGDMLFVTIKEKKAHLYAKILGRKQVSSCFPLEREELTVASSVEAYIQYILDDGYVAFTLQGDEIFVHQNFCRKQYRLGEKVNVTILKMNTQHEYTASLIEQKEKMMSSDGEIILHYLKNHQGEMRFTDRSSPEDISYAFNMSKSAFKRALGTLYKSGKVHLYPNKTTLKEE